MDIYVCGFPCQSFSLLGDRTGLKTKNNVLVNVLKTINISTPKTFLLENVEAIQSLDNGIFFEKLIEKLKKSGIYNIYYKVLNAKNFNCPQNRKRMYIVGIKKDIDKRFEYPLPKKFKYDLEKIIIDKKKYPLTDKEYIKRWLPENHDKNLYVILTTNYGGYYNKYFPTICTHSNYYLSKYNRKPTSTELLKVQGFEKNFKVVVSRTQIGKQIGNSMSVNVIAKILEQMIKMLN